MPATLLRDISRSRGRAAAQPPPSGIATPEQRLMYPMPWQAGAAALGVALILSIPSVSPARNAAGRILDPR